MAAATIVPATPPPAPQAPVLAIVSLSDQHITLYGTDGLIERSRISSGTAENPTPTGIFGVTQKNRWHESNLYSGAEMPYMQRLTWGGVALHEGKLPGYPASHGCIRLPGAFAERLFGMTRSGFRVVIAPDDIEPVAITHRVLPSASYRSVPVVQTDRHVRTAGLGDSAVVSPPVAFHTFNPQAFAALERTAARAELKPAEEAEGRGATVHDAAVKRARLAAATAKTTERRLSEATSWLTGLGLAGPAPATDRPPLDRKFPAAFREYADALAAAEAAIAEDTTARAEAVIAKSARDAAEARVEWLKARISEMGRRTETASILISRKNQRLYVRQGLRAVFDMPITIREPGEEIGNHVFVAVAPAAGETALRWLAVSMPAEDRPLRVSKSVPPSERAVARAIRAETAAGALDRIEITGEHLDRLSELVWAGSSLIVTDNGPGHDGIPGHDFAVETKH